MAYRKHKVDWHTHVIPIATRKDIMVSITKHDHATGRDYEIQLCPTVSLSC
jgi:hypothetical protein